MILDLSVFQPETLDITMLNGEVIHIKKPEQGMVIELFKFRKLSEDANAKKAIRALNDMTALILNNNEDDVHFDRKSIEALSIDVKLAIVNAFTKFVLKVQSNPT
nr:MAG TPA: hypothetical protein [Caudoviricetes sp.]